jgi:zinc protease
MKRKTILFLAVTLCLAASLFFTGTALAQKGPKDKFTFPPLSAIKMPPVKEAKLGNGMKLYLVEDHDYPTVDLRAMVGAGTIYDPADKVGLGEITGTVLRTGGTDKMTGDQIDELLESLGASIETGIQEGSGYVSVSVLKEDLDKGIELLADILMHPAFAQDKIDLAKIEQRSMISRRNDDIMGISDREYNCLIYGKENPYARYPEYATIDAISKDDIVNFYQTYFHPNNIIFAAWGDFKSDELKKKLGRAFAGWKRQKMALPKKPGVDYKYRYTVNYIDKPDVNQSHIMMGHIGGLLSNPDYPALTVMNQILTFDRMFKTIRTKEGLTYAPWGYFGAEYDHPGVFSCGTQTKSESTVRAIRLMMDEIKRITREQVTNEELARAKDSFLNSFVFNFDSKAEIVYRLMTYAYYNYPPDFIQRTKAGVEAVTKADVLRVAKKYLHPDDLQILVVGNQKDFGEPLSSLGKVNTIDITIPQPAGEKAPEAGAASVKRAKEVLEAAIAAHGGKEKLSAVKNFSAKGTMTQTTPMGEMSFDIEAIVVFPDKTSLNLQTPMGPVTMTVAGDEGWAGQGGKVGPLLPQQREEMLKDIKRDIFNIMSHPDAYKIQYSGEQLLDGKPCHDILVSRDDMTMHLLVDKASNLIDGTRYQSFVQGSPAEITTVLGNYRDVKGIQAPMKSTASAADKKLVDLDFTEMDFNVEVPPDTFVKPAPPPPAE